MFSQQHTTESKIKMSTSKKGLKYNTIMCGHWRLRERRSKILLCGECGWKYLEPLWCPNCKFNLQPKRKKEDVLHNTGNDDRDSDRTPTSNTDTPDSGEIPATTEPNLETDGIESET